MHTIESLTNFFGKVLQRFASKAKDVATSFKNNILSRGGVEHPMELYKKFRGTEPKVEPLLKRSGLL